MSDRRLVRKSLVVEHCRRRPKTSRPRCPNGSLSADPGGRPVPGGWETASGQDTAEVNGAIMIRLCAREARTRRNVPEPCRSAQSPPSACRLIGLQSLGDDVLKGRLRHPFSRRDRHTGGPTAVGSTIRCIPTAGKFDRQRRHSGSGLGRRVGTGSDRYSVGNCRLGAPE
jgi:hypothetical protein